MLTFIINISINYRRQYVCGYPSMMVNTPTIVLYTGRFAERARRGSTTDLFKSRFLEFSDVRKNRHHSKFPLTCLTLLFKPFLLLRLQLQASEGLAFGSSLFVGIDITSTTTFKSSERITAHLKTNEHTLRIALYIILSVDRRRHHRGYHVRQ